MDTVLKFKKLTTNAITPTYAHKGDACFDLYLTKASGIDNSFVLVESEFPVICHTGLAFDIPDGYVMLIFSRSGQGFSHDVRLANCVGVIDSGYKGEVIVKLTADTTDQVNSYKRAPYSVSAGDRIAQAMLIKLPSVDLLEVTDVGLSDRGIGGLGSTGK